MDTERESDEDYDEIEDIKVMPIVAITVYLNKMLSLLIQY